MDIELDCKPDLNNDVRHVNLVEHTVLDPYSDMIQICWQIQKRMSTTLHI